MGMDMVMMWTVLVLVMVCVVNQGWVVFML